MSKADNLEDLVRIFNVDKKKDLLTLSKSVTIHSIDFAHFIMVCEAGLLPYRHSIHYRDIVPDHLEPNESDLEAFANHPPGKLDDNALKLIRKVGQIFKDRRYLVGHMFFTHDLKYWHFFHFDQRDFSLVRNHWKFGPHIHFLNYLWPKLDAKTVWNQFTSKKPLTADSIHIRYRDDNRAQNAKASRLPP